MTSVNCLEEGQACSELCISLSLLFKFQHFNILCFHNQKEVAYLRIPTTGALLEV